MGGDYGEPIFITICFLYKKYEQTNTVRDTDLMHNNDNISNNNNNNNNNREGFKVTKQIT